MPLFHVSFLLGSCEFAAYSYLQEKVPWLLCTLSYPSGFWRELIWEIFFPGNLAKDRRIYPEQET